MDVSDRKGARAEMLRVRALSVRQRRGLEHGLMDDLRPRESERRRGRAKTNLMVPTIRFAEPHLRPPASTPPRSMTGAAVCEVCLIKWTRRSDRKSPSSRNSDVFSNGCSGIIVGRKLHIPIRTFRKEYGSWSGRFMVSEERKLLSASQAASKLGVTPQHLRLLLRVGKLKGIRVGRAWAVAEEDLRDFQASRMVEQFSFIRG
jgi:excisionase family DNA binding protein